MNRLACLILVAASLGAGCGDLEHAAPFAIMDAPGPAHFSGSYLAIEHSITIDVADDVVEQAHQSVLDACANDAEKMCAVLGSSLTHGEYMMAEVRMRVRPAGVNPLIDLASGFGEVVRRETGAEDLAKPVLDTNKRVAMLEAYLADLLRLRQQSRHEIDALIRVASEIAKTQSELDNAKAEQAQLAQRVQLQVLHLRFHSDRRDSFWAPIGSSLGEFKSDLSHGIAGTISGFAFLLPWLLILFALALLVRWLWRRFR